MSLISHQWKQSTRSAYFEKGIMIRIFLGIMFLYLAINLFIIGLFVGKIIQGAFPDDDPVWAFSIILFYYFLADILIRFFLQPLPVLGIVPYLHLPVKRSGLFNFLLLKSGLSLFNYLPLLILLPFTLKSVLPVSGGSASLLWLTAVVLLIFSNNYLAFILKKLYLKKSWLMPVLLLVVVSLLMADYKSHQAVSGIFANALTVIAANAYLLPLPLTFLLILYPASWILLYQNRYLELTTKKEKLLFSHNRHFHDAIRTAYYELGKQVVRQDLYFGPQDAGLLQGQVLVLYSG